VTEPVGRVVIVGAGQAGADAAAALRMAGHEGEIVLVGEEPSPPYARPPLSKAFLAGEVGEESLLIRSPSVYASNRITVRAGTAVARIDREAHEIVLASGERLGYDRLVLATGGEPRRLDTPETARASNVLTLRTLADATALREYMRPGARAVIIGAGYVGLEIAAAARARGLEVTVVEVAPRVLARVTSPVVSAFFERIHREEGVEIITGATVDGYEVADCGDVTGVRLADGRVLPGDFVLFGVGMVPRTELAEQAGLHVDNGIVVDDRMRTTDPDVFAIGDVSSHPDPRNGGLRRLESVPNASEQARIVASVITGSPRPYDATPWFWSDQYDLKLQTAGLAAAYDDLVVRDDPADGRRLTVLYLRGHVVIAADTVNRPADFAAARKLIAAGRPVDLDVLRDSGVPLRSLVATVAKGNR
jgi:3-phenylpropionate/trans-cinnamate dioxygenase ferredoxin reductase subunit